MLYKILRPTTFTSHSPRTRSPARCMFAVKMSLPAPWPRPFSKTLHKRGHGRTTVSLRNTSVGSAPYHGHRSVLQYTNTRRKLQGAQRCSQTLSLYRRRQMGRQGAQEDLSRMLNILYSKFCAATLLPSTKSKLKYRHQGVQGTNRED